MIAVIFEVEPRGEAERASYLEIAASLRSLVEEVDGFVGVERFQSLTNPRKMLSVSFFRDEAAVDQRRRLVRHRAAQTAGRDHLFADYRLRIAQVIRDYGMTERGEAPEDSRALNG